MDVKEARITAELNRHLNLWQVRLVETVSGDTKEDAELRATRLLAVYHRASNMVTSPTQWMDAMLVAECTFWQNKYEELKGVTWTQ